jgi:hypothetical protein
MEIVIEILANLVKAVTSWWKFTAPLRISEPLEYLEGAAPVKCK